MTWKAFQSILWWFSHCICLYLVFWTLFFITPSLRYQYWQQKRADTADLPTLTASSCHSLASTKQNPISKYRLLSHFSLPFFSVGLVLQFSLEAGDNLVSFSGRPSDPMPLPGKNAMVLAERAQTQDNETLPGAKSAHHFGSVPWQPCVAPATSRLGICPGKGRSLVPAASSSPFPGTADRLG